MTPQYRAASTAFCIFLLVMTIRPAPANAVTIGDAFDYCLADDVPEDCEARQEACAVKAVGGNVPGTATPQQIAAYRRCFEEANKRGAGKWQFDFRQCHARKSLGSLEQGWGDKVAVDLDDIRELQKLIPQLQKCEAWFKCLNDREMGKVKHCYENDRRWR